MSEDVLFINREDSRILLETDFCEDNPDYKFQCVEYIRRDIHDASYEDIFYKKDLAERKIEKLRVLLKDAYVIINVTVEVYGDSDASEWIEKAKAILNKEKV